MAGQPVAGELTVGRPYVVCVPVATLWTGPDAPRPGDAAALRDGGDIRAWTSGLGVEERRGLHGRVDSQVLAGEAVLVDEVAGEWAKVVVPGQPSSLDPRGYPGWLLTCQIAAPPPAAATAGTGSRVVVTALTADAYGERLDAAVVRDLSFGTVLPVAAAATKDRPGWLPVDLAGRSDPLWLRSSDVEHYPVTADDGQRLVDAAAGFIGLPYLWGGRSGLGVDCSGLVHLVHQRFGVILPRDAHDQASGGTEVPVDDAGPGDLYFFAGSGTRITHVGIVAGAGRMLHAPETGRGVEFVALSEERRRTLVLARRYWG